MRNGDVGNVSGGGNVQWNRKLAEDLDAADGKKDGKISANIWNGFIKHAGSSGNKIKWNISVDNAAKSFAFYDSKKDAGKVDWGNWNGLYESFTGKKADAPQPPETKPVEPSPGNTSGDVEKPTAPVISTQSTVATMHPSYETQKKMDFENAMKAVNFQDTVPNAEDLKAKGFGLNAYPSQTLGDITINPGIQDSDGLYHMLDMNGGRTYHNANGESVKISDFDAQFVAPGGTSVQYSDGKGTSRTIIYDKDGNPVQGSLFVKQDDGNVAEYHYNYKDGKPVLMTKDAEKPVKPVETGQQIQQAGIEAGADDERLSHVAPQVVSDVASSIVPEPVQLDKRKKVEITDDYKDNGDGTKTKTYLRPDGKPGLMQTVDQDGHVISESVIRKGLETGKEIEIRRNYFADGSIEKLAFVDGEKMDSFSDGEMLKLGEVQFLVKDSPLKLVDGKMPAEADLIKAGYKKDTSIMTMNGGAVYHNEQTGESVMIDPTTNSCEYRKGDITQRHSYDKDGNLVYGTLDIKGKDGAFETHTYQKNEDYSELTVTSDNYHEAPSSPAAFAEDAIAGHWRNIDTFKAELKMPDDLSCDLKEGTSEKISKDGKYKMNVTVDSSGNVVVAYSEKQADGSFKEIGSYKLTKYDSPGSLRGYDYQFEAYNNLTDYKRTASGGDWRGDY